jgi:CRP/FNR family cyclic AMP-dependent transcriptional regulator
MIYTYSLHALGTILGCTRLNRQRYFCCLNCSPCQGLAFQSQNALPRSGGTLKSANQKASHLRDFYSGDALGGEVSSYRQKQDIYTQGEPAETLFYIQKGGVRLSTRRNNRQAAVTAILGVGDFFGELCLADYPLRMSTAVALTASSIRTIKKEKMLQLIRANNKTSRSLLAHLLSRIKSYRDHVADLLTCSAEQRLAHVLLRLAHLGKSGRTGVKLPHLTDKVLAEMVGTTRSRINAFMNRFRKQGFISNAEGIEVRPSLRKAFGTR